MDLLVDADTEGKVQEAVFFACADLLNLEVDLLFFDTTSTYFERDEPAAAGEHGKPAFRAYGHSKDHRPDLPQVIIGLAVTREGIPVRVWVWPGNTNDMSVLAEVKDDMRGWRLGRVVTVVDRGFSFHARCVSYDNSPALQNATFSDRPRRPHAALRAMLRVVIASIRFSGGAAGRSRLASYPVVVSGSLGPGSK